MRAIIASTTLIDIFQFNQLDIDYYSLTYFYQSYIFLYIASTMCLYAKYGGISHREILLNYSLFNDNYTSALGPI